MTLCGSKASRRALLALVPLTALLWSNVGHAAPATAITTCPFSIATSGQYYLAADLTCPPGLGITIERASDVHLRLDGHTLQGSSGRGIAALFSTAIVIQGPGTITGFQDGLFFVDVDSSKVIQVTATRNSIAGFVVIGSLSTNNLFQGNVATLNDDFGIEIIGSVENTITNNLVMNNEVGIDLAFANLNKIYANTATSNTFRGISLAGTQNEIGGNTALGNAVEDMFDSAPNCDDNRWRGNRFGTANQSCIQ
jgi:parallel beta-helix repeat protein